MPLPVSVRTRLEYQHETVTEIMTGFEEAQLKLRVNPDKWSAFENIVHLVAYQPVFIERIGLMEKQIAPLFERYTADLDPLFHLYLKKTLPELSAILVNDRATILGLLSDLNDEQLKYIGRHPKYGALTIAEWAEFFLLHEAHHIWTSLPLLYAQRSNG